jgi:hypothetical protein
MSDLNIQLNENLVKPIIEEKIKLAIIESFKGQYKLIENVIYTLMDTKVDSDGKRSSYSSDNRYSLLDILIRKELEKKAEELIKIITNECIPDLEKELRKILTTKKFADSLAGAVLNSVKGKDYFSIKFNVSLEKFRT